MERGGGSSKRSRIDANDTPRNLKEKSEGVGRTVSSSGTRLGIQKKRSRMVLSDSESSDETMTLKPRRSSVDSKTLGAKEKRDRAEHDRNGYVRRNNEASGSLMKTKKLDVFEFDEYDGFDSANLMRKRFDNGSVGVSGRSSFAPRKVDSSMGRSGSSRNGVIDKKRNTCVNGTGSMKSQEDSSSESDSGVPMKVKVNNKSSTLTESINHQDAEIYERPPCSKKAQRREDVVVKSTFRKSNNVDNDSASEESDLSRKSKRRKIVFTKPKKGINTKSKSTVPEPVKLDVREERRGRGSGGTEKQRLRERIKGMLTDAGWTVEYKPRRNQSYLDAVYVNPSGIAYWSIVKAYDALREQLKDEEIDARPRKVTAAVASVSEDIVNKLARKAKKSRAEMTKKGKKNSTGSDSENDSDRETNTDLPEGRIRSSIQLGGKSRKKGRHGTDPDDLPRKSKRSLFYSNARPSSGSDSHYLHGRKSKKIERCTLLVRGPKDKKSPAFDGFNPYSEKRTLLSWLIESGVVQLRQKVQYMKRLGAKVMLEGRITREGIHCGCCSKILTVSRFEIHAGSKSCQPFQHIYLDSGTSLLQCQLKAWNMQKDATNLFHQVDTDGDDPNDDTCGICGDGGDLICCDSCPSTYHQSCLGLQVLPPGDWHCPNCTCKFCGEAGSGDGSLLSLLSCDMCERRYHQSCTSELEADKVQSFGSAYSFCGPQCLELFEKLQKYLGVKNEIEGGYSWSLIRRVETDSDTKSQLSAETIENNSKLAVGLAIMDECFLPIIDRRSGINLIRNALYNCGSNFSRINYTGFYTAILEREDEIISAASLRFHGIQSAEMPFIGTRHIYRRQGMCRRLFDAIESAMRSLKVEKLVIPAIPDFLPTWTGNFGFTPLDDSVRKEMRHLNILAFPGIEMLQKLLLLDESIIADSAAGDTINSEIETEKKENIHISVEKATDTISKLDGEEGGISSSPCQIILKPDTISGYICEDTGSSSCEGSLTDMNVQADTSLLFQELQNASAKLQVESNNLTSSISGRVLSDLSSISEEAKG